MTHLSLSEFSDKVGELMPVIAREFIRHQADGFYKTKVTWPQFIVLELLNRKGESRMTDLAHFIDVTTAAMTGIVERLVRDGYVARGSEPGDRRIIKVRLTPKGISMVKGMMEQRKKITMEIFSVISQEEREEYLKILAHIHEHLKYKEAEV